MRPGPRRAPDLEAGRYEPPCPTCGEPSNRALVDEDAAADPRNVYAATKLHQEHLCTAFGREHDVPVTMLRYHNVYGPRMPRDTPYAGVASIFRSRLAKRPAPPLVLEDGGQRRDFVHVDRRRPRQRRRPHRARALRRCVERGQRPPCTMLQMARRIAGAIDPDPGARGDGGYRLGDVRHVVASPARAVDAIGFRAEVPPAEGLAAFATAPLRRAASG